MRATVDIGYGPFEITPSSYGGGFLLRAEMLDGSVARVRLEFPDEDDFDDLKDGVQVNPDMHYGMWTVGHAKVQVVLLRSAIEIAEQVNETMLVKLEEARHRAAREQAELERRMAERKVLMAEREERCLMEFVDCDVKVRVRGYKSVVRATIVARQRSYDSDEYMPWIQYVHYNDQMRPNRIDQVQRLEVKVGSRYKLVWDDGKDDLPSWDRGGDNRVIQPYEGGSQ